MAMLLTLFACDSTHAIMWKSCGRTIRARPLRDCARPCLGRFAMTVVNEKTISNEAEVWRLREQIVRRSYEVIFNIKEDELDRVKRYADEERDSGETTRSAFITSAVAVVVGAIVLRIGGRTALVSALGLDIVADLGIGDKIDQVVQYADALGGWSIVAFFAAWVLAKVFLIDFVSIALAIASGVIFGGVFEGAALSAIGATLGSLVAFQLSRTLLQERVVETVDNQPIARALSKVVEEDGFKTVFVLRLSPILPIPLGAYAYIYGVSALDTFSFASGTLLGSIKPYLVDSYLGVFSKQIIDGDSLDASKDLILLVGIGALVLVGVFATDLAGEAFDRVQLEIKADAKARKEQGIAEVDDTGGEWEVGPISTSKVRRWAGSTVEAVVPVGAREEFVVVWEYLRGFCDEQWDPAVAMATTERQKREIEEEQEQDTSTAGDLFGWFTQPDSLGGAVAAKSLRKPRAETVVTSAGVAGDTAQPLPSVATMLYGPDEEPAADEERRRLAEWSFDGPQPWRQALTSIVFTFAVFHACASKWGDYPEDGLYSGLSALEEECARSASAP